MHDPLVYRHCVTQHRKDPPLMNKLPLLALLVTLAGCAAVPTSELRFGTATARLPKDSSADELDVVVKSGTNSFTFRARNWTTRNNPAVIGASTEQIKAHYAGSALLIREGVVAGIGAATKVP